MTTLGEKSLNHMRKNLKRSPLVATAGENVPKQMTCSSSLPVSSVVTDGFKEESLLDEVRRLVVTAQKELIFDKSEDKEIEVIGFESDETKSKKLTHGPMKTSKCEI
ncbi:hypothetical protein CHS0354_020393 [Potamilus streckersoni]|uniref:Uncharacterized protein n=1 Tax=Potamilus streckersoni TaxID=2493646 RepID=A0AAE0TFI2_9BIVA|nr:hypothetical protein CHS0354_020393 [Potamilus streckersoni]